MITSVRELMTLVILLMGAGYVIRLFQEPEEEVNDER